MKPTLLATGAALALAVGSALAADVKDDKNLNFYLVDVSPGPVAAGAIVGLSGSAVTDVQSAKDFVLALNPFSSKDAKSGYGLAVTPARTAILPMSGQTYANGGALTRMLGSTTLSYAENVAELSKLSYRKSAYSLSTMFYLDPDSDDPVVLGALAFADCPERKKIETTELFLANKELAKAQAAGDNAKVLDAQANVDAALDKATKAAEACGKAKKYTTRWNATKFGLSLGQGWIQGDAGGPKHPLGKRLTLSGIVKSGADSAVYLTLQRVANEVDLTTLATTAVLKSSSLAAARFTFGSSGTANQRLLAEISNAKASKATSANSAFRYALGLDQKVFEGLWLELRVGKKRITETGKDESVALFNLNFAPSPKLFEK